MAFFALKRYFYITNYIKKLALCVIAFFQKRSVFMIEIVTKNVEQIGRPTEDDRIYISDKAYKKVRSDGVSEKSVYVLMGHTESSGGKYATFIEAAIPVWDIEFEHNVPIWNNHVWNGVFSEIKRSYEDSIIVGWAYDRRGYRPESSPELERIHREHFGGAHQLLFLLDSLQSDERFYINKNNRLCERHGFFIYYKMDDKKEKINREEPKESVVELKLPEEIPVKIPENRTAGIARYRETMAYQTPQKSSETKGLSIAIVAMIALMIVLAGVTMYSKGFSLSDNLRAIQTIASPKEEAETQIPVENIYR